MKGKGLVRRETKHSTNITFLSNQGLSCHGLPAFLVETTEDLKKGSNSFYSDIIDIPFSIFV